jgi:hypothetical protein
MEWEVGDLVESDEKVYRIGRISSNSDGSMALYRLDRKFEESIHIIFRSKEYVERPSVELRGETPAAVKDEREGPYKVVQSLSTSHRDAPVYSIAYQRKSDVFFSTIIPNVGNGDTARKVCNLLNKEAKRMTEEAMEFDAAHGLDEAGLSDPNQ